MNAEQILHKMGFSISREIMGNLVYIVVDGKASWGTHFDKSPTKDLIEKAHSFCCQIFIDNLTEIKV